jgi:uncharacterized protein YjbI with pentapeptide repeats
MLKKKLHGSIGECLRCTEGSCSTEGAHQIFTASEKRLLSGIVLFGVELDRVDFSNADLRNAEFIRASLVAADFSGADLRGASFFGCDLREACFKGALFQLTRFDDSWLIGRAGFQKRCVYTFDNGARTSGVLEQHENVGALIRGTK